MPDLQDQRASESGSAYLISLFLLAVLSVMGLGLAVVTQTEMIVGGTERTLQRLFYSADSGVQRAAAAAINEFNCNEVPANEFVLEDVDLDLQQEVGVSVVLPVLDPPCPLCGINNTGGSTGYHGKTSYFEVHHAVSAEATRTNDSGDELGARTIGAFVAVQPWPQLESCYKLTNTAEAADVQM